MCPKLFRVDLFSVQTKNEKFTEALSTILCALNDEYFKNKKYISVKDTKI